MKDNKIRLIIIASAFFLFLAGGIGIGKLLKKDSDPPRVTSASGFQNETVKKELNPAKKTAPKVDSVSKFNHELKLTATKPTMNGKYYSFTAELICNCQQEKENHPECDIHKKFHYELWSGKNCVASSDNGIFTKIATSTSGSYKLLAIDEMGRELASILVSGFKEKESQRMTAAQFQRLLLSGDTSLLGGRNPQVAKSISVHCQGLADGDKAPYDVQSVRDKINFGVWHSATVISVGYDDKNKINSVTIKPVY